MLSPCLGLYYLLSGLRRIMGEMYAVSLSGSLLPAFRPCWIMGEMDAVSLSGPLPPAFRPPQDNGGDEMLSPYQFTSLHNGLLVEVLFKTVWSQYSAKFLVPRIRLNELIFEWFVPYLDM